MKTQSCKIIELIECDVLYQAKYYRVCEHCGKQEEGLKERFFPNILKNGLSTSIDNWTCPFCNHLNITNIECEDSDK